MDQPFGGVFQSLNLKLLLPLALIAVVLILLSIHVGDRLRQDSFETYIREHAESISEVLAGVVAAHGDDEALLDDILAATVAGEIERVVIVHESDGLVSASSERHLIGLPMDQIDFSDLPDLLSQLTSGVQVAQHIDQENKVFHLLDHVVADAQHEEDAEESGHHHHHDKGHYVLVEVEISEDLQALNDARWYSMIVASTVILFLVAFCYIVLNHMVISPINRLRRAFAEVDQPHVRGLAEVESQDEIGRLAAAFNDMNKRLSGQQQELKKLAMIAGHTNSSIILTDAQGRIEWTNQAFETMSGYQNHEVKGRLLADVLLTRYSENDVVCFSMRSNLASRKPFHMELHRRSADMQSYWSATEVTPLHDAEGNFVGHMVLETDITSRREFERSIRESEGRLRAFLQAIPDPVYLLTTDGSFQSLLNDESTSTFPHEALFIGKTIEQLFDKEQTARLNEAIYSTNKTGESQRIEYSIEHEGKEYWFEGHIAPTPAGLTYRRSILWIAREITQQREMQQELKSLAYRFKTATEGAGLGVWQFNVDTGELLWDSAMHAVYGTDADTYVPSYEGWQALLHKDDLNYAEELFANSLETGEKFETMFRIHRPDGEIRYVTAEAVIQFDEQSGHTIATGINADVTELRMTENRLSTAMKAAQIGLWDWNLLTDETYFSDTFYTMLGYEPGELPMSLDTWKELCHPDDLATAIGEIEAYLEGERAYYQNEHRLRMKDGSWLWIRDIGEAVEWDDEGKPIRMTGVHISIQNLKEMTNRLELSLEAGNAGAWDWAVQKKTYCANEVFFQMFGEEPLEGELDDDNFFSRVHEDDLGRVFSEIESAFEREDGRVDVELRVRCADDSYKWLRSVGKVVERNEDGEVTRMMGHLTDISARIKNEERIREALLQAQNANVAKTEFLANMSHELRTPMTAILGYADLITDIESQVDSSVIDAVSTIRQNGKHLLSLLNDILDMSKIEAGKLAIKKEDISLHKMVEEIAESMSVRAEEKNLKIHISPKFPLPETIHTDPIRLRQVIVNLVGNAIKFTETGSVRIRYGVHKCGEDDAAFVQVIDTGIGVQEHQMHKLFKPFEQADASTTRKFGGTGLGLTISRRLAQLLGGDIQVCSHFGRGSTFTASFDAGDLSSVKCISTQKELAAIETQEPAKADYRSFHFEGHVLLAEDSIVNQKLVRRLLENAGFTVETADDGLLALEAVKAAQENNHPFDLIILDMQMPNMDGYTAADRLRCMQYDIPIIALTAHAMAGDREKCIEAGCNDYATKPIDQALLFEIISKYVQGADVMHHSA